MSDPVKIPAPNYTQLPNAVLDLMPDMEETELRVVLAIARQTFGWHKKRDKISLTQLEKLTGLSRQGVVNGILAGEKRGLVEKTKDESDKRGGIWYRLIIHDDNQSTELTGQLNRLVKNIDQSTELTRTSQLNGLELVNSVDTQKKEKERKERGSANHARTPAVQAYFDAYPTERLNADQVQQISTTVTDIGKWQAVLNYWKASNYRAQSIPKMLDRYSSGSTVATDRPNGNRQASITRPPADLPMVTAEHKPVISTDERRRIIESRMAPK